MKLYRIGWLCVVAGCSQAQGPVATTEDSYGDGISCAQVAAGIKHENLVINLANAQARQGGQTKLLALVGNSQIADLGQSYIASAALVPGPQGETELQKEADQVGTDAFNLANELVVIGRLEKCFR